MAALDSEQKQAKQHAQSKVESLKEQLKQVETRLAKLLDVFLSDVLSTEEYAAKNRNCYHREWNFKKKLATLSKKDCLGSNRLVSS